jgi:hypothetical protein
MCATAYENIEITTRSHPEAFPSALRQKRKTQTKVHEADAALLKVRSILCDNPLLIDCNLLFAGV